MAITFSDTNKPLNPRGNDASPLAYNKAAIYSGKALDFDGANDEVSLDGFTMSGNTASFAFYLKADEWNNGDFIFDSRPTRFSIGGDSANANTLNIRSGTSWIKLADISDTTNTNHFVITIDGTTAKLFLNGQSFGYEVTLSSEIDLSSNANTALMSYSAGASSYFNGQLSGFKIFNTALTPAQVADLYNNPEKIVPTGVDNTALKLWLPMQEGAGTTAYDGSGNGNHGTISGATYVNGIGAPVAQTAVIDWNKGTNLVAYSADLEGNWSLSGGTWTSGQDDPIGGANAYKITSTGSDPWLFKNATSEISGTQYTAKCWVKGAVGREARLWIIRDNINFESQDFTLTGNWQEIETTKTFPTTPTSFVSFRLDIPNDTPVSGDVGYLFAPRLVAGDNADVYIPTLATTQPSPVLLPQGLTTGRDITGVNLFENVRKQGALNLDGKSWAEVHKNDSIPEGDEGRTLECWFFGVDKGATQSYIETGNTSGTGTRFGILTISDDSIYIVGQGYDINTLVAMNLDAWNHVAVTHDGSTLKVYKDGLLIKTGTGRTYVTANADVVLGRNGSTGLEDSFGSIAQPRIYNRALTAGEVLQNYNSGKNTYK